MAQENPAAPVKAAPCTCDHDDGPEDLYRDAVLAELVAIRRRLGTERNVISAAALRVAAEPVELVPAAWRGSVSFQNRGAESIFVDGDSGVTLATGFEIPAGATLTLTKARGAALWGIAAAGPVDLRRLVES